ncbi:MAG: bifunctional DNA primase/polymerase [Acidobacteria bacterium]|nr:bifunctional DNA primase/polymerase [Acidobacteriota bacterium]
MSKQISSIATANVINDINNYSSALKPSVEEKINAAISYLALGWAVIPVKCGTKQMHYKISKKQRGTNKTTKHTNSYAKCRATLDEIREWFEIDLDCNIGTLTGQCSRGLYVFDWDTKKIPKKCCKTLTAKSKTKKGYHDFYYCPKKIPSTNITINGKHYGEIRGDGVLVVLPPSVHETGWIYEWQDLFSPSEAGIAEIPRALLEMVRKRLKIKSSNPVKSKNTRSASSKYSLLADSPSGFISSSNLKEVDTNESNVKEMCKVLNIPPVELGQHFLCVLPHHQEKRPSASVYRADNKQFVYRDFHSAKHQCKPAMLLVEVYAAQAYGEVRQLNKPELAVWHLRLLVEAKLLQPVEISSYKLSENSRPLVKKLYEGFLLLLGCKWLYSPNSPTTFSHRFAAAWCGISECNVGEAMAELLKIKAIKKVGEVVGSFGKKMSLFLPN